MSQIDRIMQNWIEVENFKYPYLLKEKLPSENKVLYVRWFKNWIKKLKYNRFL